MVKKVALGLLALFVIIIGAAQFNDWLNEKRDKKSLKESDNLFFIPAKVDSYSSVSKSRKINLHYTYSIAGKKYSNTRTLVKNRIEPPTVPFNILVAVDTLNPDLNFGLFIRDDFIYFGKELPDSLQWINSVLKNGW
ncbi:hypothetical protein IQ13_2066 [Lacibacter cauensis]|uniref:Uncharacterized protein n=1 Tax=Lacibacter cauensis TaxID=510947 RepID=A0A562SRR2_9BACT|nr:hypothetical protein [Lacibacter cauensis]TWI83947.1 hypothetical protein IQ13_2066 [Lacibacter cauensis]